MNVQKYLDRIQYSTEIKISKEVLFDLQKQHLFNIPFENLDIHYNNKIELNLEKIYQKIIIDKRGGFCYELNALFNQLLNKIGFKSILISGKVHVEKNTYGKEFDHMAIIINLDSKIYLVDVGFGKFTLRPIEIVLDKLQIDDYGEFVFNKYDADYYKVNKVDDGILIPQYKFKIEERKLCDFEGMCTYHQTSNKSHFTKKKIISIAKSNGRITLNDSSLKIMNMDENDKITFKENEFEHYLKKYFDIELKGSL